MGRQRRRYVGTVVNEVLQNVEDRAVRFGHPRARWKK
jgi:hypothetical protein